MGKGLGITSTSTGNYVAISAGTGLLTFMDLVAYIGRSYFADNEPVKFHFTLYASFPSREEAIGLALLEAVALRCPEVFTLKLMLSDS